MQIRELIPQEVVAKLENRTSLLDQVASDVLAIRENSAKPRDSRLKGLTWERLYRKHAKSLRALVSAGKVSGASSDVGSDPWRASHFLQEISLNTTVPWNELETPWWIDSMTGEVTEDGDALGMEPTGGGGKSVV